MCDFDPSQTQEHLDKAKILLAKINQIYAFENYEADPKNNLKAKDVQGLIDALKAQCEFLHQSEECLELFREIK